MMLRLLMSGRDRDAIVEGGGSYISVSTMR